MMDRLEKGSGNTVLSEREAQGLLRDDENLVLAVYDYWLAKRLRLVGEGSGGSSGIEIHVDRSILDECTLCR